MQNTDTHNSQVQNSNNQASFQNGASSLRSNPRLFALIAIISFSLLTILMIMSGNKAAQALDDNKLLVTQNTNVEAMRVELQDSYVKPRIVFGQIESVQQSEIGFEFSGLLDSLVVLEGAVVEKGDILARLDTSRLKARQNELNSALQNAEANLRLSQISETRVRDLVAKKLEPRQTLDEAEAQLDASRANVNEAQARIASLAVDISKSNLIAPFSGQVVRQYIDAGTVVNPGQAVFSILAKQDLEARFGLPEQIAFDVSVGQTYPLTIQNQSFMASVKSVAQQRNLATRTIDAVFTIKSVDLTPQQQQSIVAGDLVSVTVDIPIEATGAWVPISSLASAVRGLWSLYVVENDNTIQTRLVSVRYADKEKAYVTGAIKSGDNVVVSGIHRLTPNQTVNNVTQVDAALAAMTSRYL